MNQDCQNSSKQKFQFSDRNTGNIDKTGKFTQKSLFWKVRDLSDDMTFKQRCLAFGTK